MKKEMEEHLNIQIKDDDKRAEAVKDFLAVEFRSSFFYSVSVVLMIIFLSSTDDSTMGTENDAEVIEVVIAV